MEGGFAYFVGGGRRYASLTNPRSPKNGILLLVLALLVFAGAFSLRWQTADVMGGVQVPYEIGTEPPVHTAAPPPPGGRRAYCLLGAARPAAMMTGTIKSIRRILACQEGAPYLFFGMKFNVGQPEQCTFDAYEQAIASAFDTESVVAVKAEIDDMPHMADFTTCHGTFDVNEPYAYVNSAQAYSWKWCYHEIERYEKEHGFRFDYAVKIRTDATWPDAGSCPQLVEPERTIWSADLNPTCGYGAMDMVFGCHREGCHVPFLAFDRGCSDPELGPAVANNERCQPSPQCLGFECTLGTYMDMIGFDYGHLPYEQSPYPPHWDPNFPKDWESNPEVDLSWVQEFTGGAP